MPTLIQPEAKAKRAQRKSQEQRLQQLIDEYYIGLGDTTEKQVQNILLDTEHADIEHPIYEILDVMRQPQYFSYTCRHLLNIELIPFQVAILQELWHRKFPMLIMTRGGGKTWMLALYALLRALFEQGTKVVVVGAAFRQSKLIFEYMEQFWRGSPILRSIVGMGKHQGPKRDIDRCNFYVGESEIIAIPLGDGCLYTNTLTTNKNGFGYIKHPAESIWGNGEFRVVDEHYNNGVKPTKIIKTNKGYGFEGTHNHKMKVLRNGSIDFVRSDEMVIGDRILLDRSRRWHDGDFQCTDEQAYALGLMIGDGCWTSIYQLRFATTTPGEFVPYLDYVASGNEWTQLDEQHWQCCGKDNIKKWIDFWELREECRTKDKTLPPKILSARQSAMTACLQGLFDTDGHVQVQTTKGGMAITIGFTNTSQELVRQMQYILLHYGIVAHVSDRDRDENWNHIYELIITGADVKIFAEQIGFRLKRKQQLLEAAIANKSRWVNADDIIPGVLSDMVRIASQYRVRWGHSNADSTACSASKLQNYTQATRSLVNKFLNTYGHIDDPLIAKLHILNDDNVYYDTITSIADGEAHTYDMHVPDGHEYCADGFFSHNTKIRGLRANYVLADEFASIPQEIFEVVIKGFASVSSSPDVRVKDFGRVAALKMLGYDEQAEAAEEELGFGNQTVISGTAYYSFNHFYTYWRRYKSIIESKGAINRLEEIFHGEVPEGFDWTDYSVIRAPYKCLPRGFMDETSVAQSKATVHQSIYQMEYEACFATDSDGFFKRSLIESCVTKEPVLLASGPVQFHATISGSPNLRYVYGIDPASEKDNFAIVVLEIQGDHRRIVYSWSINRQTLRERLKNQGKKLDKSFYSYCARKIRQLMKRFPTEHIGMDTQGGGIAVMEALHEEAQMEENERPLWPYIKQGDKDVFWWEEANKPTDGEPGFHYLHMVQFAQAKFTVDANHGLRKDFEDKTTLFPYFDSASIGEALTQDKIMNREYDTMEDCVIEIEELKDELATIIHDQTSGGRDRWDTPEVKLPGNKKGRLRKDRYSALVIANMVARVMDHGLEGTPCPFVGGYVGQKRGGQGGGSGRLYVGPDHLVSKMTGLYGKGVSRQ